MNTTNEAVKNSPSNDSFIYHYPTIRYNIPSLYTNIPKNLQNINLICNYEKKDDNNDEENMDIEDASEEFFQHTLTEFCHESSLSPVLFVIDFDHTLAVFDDLYILETTITNKLPSIYTRPFLYEFLNFIKGININNVIILWTAGTAAYIKQNLLLLNIAHYFDKVLSREHCKESKKNFNHKCKSHSYLVSLFPQYKRMRSVLIDNYAYKNGCYTGYTEIISVKPFQLTDVVKMYGAYGVNPSQIKDIKLFILSKGKEGIYSSTLNDNYLKRFKNINGIYYGDITLLNVISFLQEHFFNIYFSDKSKPQNNHALINNNNNYYNNNEYIYYIITTQNETTAINKEKKLNLLKINDKFKKINKYHLPCACNIAFATI